MDNSTDEREFSYLAVWSKSSAKEQIERYFGFGAEVVEEVVDGLGTYLVVEIESRHAAWQDMRLGSGLIGSDVYDRSENALEKCYEVQELDQRSAARKAAAR